MQDWELLTPLFFFHCMAIYQRKIELGIYEKLEDLKQDVRKIINNLENKAIESLTGWNYIIEALSVVLL